MDFTVQQYDKRPAKLYGLEDKMMFGKFKEWTISQIAEEKAGLVWLDWAMRENLIELDQDAIDEFEMRIETPDGGTIFDEREKRR